MIKENIITHDELLDIVDENDAVIGQQYRSELYAKHTANFRVINAFLINSRGQVWIPRRSPHKKLFPSCLDASVGGHVMAGESYGQAFERELQEELNMSLSQAPHRLLGKLAPHKHNVSAHMHLYVIFIDQEPNYNQDDFIHATWFDLPVLQELLNQGEPAKGDLPALINYLSKSL